MAVEGGHDRIVRRLALPVDAVGIDLEQNRDAVTEAVQEETAQLAVASERGRIARELHDVIQAGAKGRMLGVGEIKPAQFG